MFTLCDLSLVQEAFMISKSFYLGILLSFLHAYQLYILFPKQQLKCSSLNSEIVCFIGFAIAQSLFVIVFIHKCLRICETVM